MYGRHLSAQIQEALADTPVVVIIGARQVGKSTLAQALATQVYTLDDLNILNAVQSDPVGFVNRLPNGSLIDEIQRAPELFLPIKASIDADRRPGRLILTGSANVLTLPRVADSLAGRMSVLRLWPLSQGELAGQREDFVQTAFTGNFPERLESDELVERLLRGGYPEVQSRSVRRRAAWFDDYLRTLLERDLRDLSRISGLVQMPRLLTLLAQRCGNLLNASDLARDAALSNVTLTRYVDLLRALFLVDSVPAWATNLGKRLIKAPKVLMPDTGLAAHLLGVNAERLRQDRKLFGQLLENFVVGELERQLGWSELDARLYHYRTASGQEVDLILEARDGRIVGLEVKASATVEAKDFKGLKALQADHPELFQRGIVLYTGQQTIQFGPALYAVPVHALWQG